MLFRNSLYNLLGLGLPLVAAVLCIPVLITFLGPERFGLLTILWAVVSYFGLCDLGLGRVLTQRVAPLAGPEAAPVLGAVVTTGLLTLGVLGCVASMLLIVLGLFGLQFFHDLPDAVEAKRAVFAMAAAMPAIIVTAGLRGLLEARHAFKAVNAIRLPMGLFTFAGPLVVAMWFGPRLDLIAIALAAGRIVACAVHYLVVLRQLPIDPRHRKGSFALAKELCLAGGWFTVSSIASPLMGYLDRFFIGAIISSSAVAYYATPHEIVTKIWIIPGAITAVLFPTFAEKVSRNSPDVDLLLVRAIQTIIWAVFPVAALLILFAREVLDIWVGSQFADVGAPLLQIFGVGIVINCAAHGPYTYILGAGRPAYVAAIHAIQLPFYGAIVWYAAFHHGLRGVAWAWLARMLVDAVAMFLVARKILRGGIDVPPRFVFGFSLALVSLFIFANIGSLYSRLLFFGCLSMLGAIVLYRSPYWTRSSAFRS